MQMLATNNSPYPPIQVEGKNAYYARLMLSNVGGRNSEMGAVSTYFYNSVMLKDESIAKLFHQVSLVEMRHLEIFAQFTRLLGQDPRLWKQEGRRHIYWNACYNHYAGTPQAIMQQAILGERAAIEKYERQMAVIDDPHIVKMLERIIQDEQLHVQAFTQIYQKLCKNCPPILP